MGTDKKKKKHTGLIHRAFSADHSRCITTKVVGNYYDIISDGSINVIFTCTRDSVRPILMAISSLMKMSGQWVLLKHRSSSLSCAGVNRVRCLFCLFGLPESSPLGPPPPAAAAAAAAAVAWIPWPVAVDRSKPPHDNLKGPPPAVADNCGGDGPLPC